MTTSTLTRAHRNELLNIFEAIAAYLVVFIHFPFPGIIGDIVTAIARISVPFFFSISGYFFYKGDNTLEIKSIPRKIKNLIKLLIISEMVYFLFYLSLQIKNTGLNLTSVKSLIESEFINYYLPNLPSRLLVLTPVFNGTAWFISSLIAVYILMYFFSKFSIQKHISYISLVLLALGLILPSVLPILNVSTSMPYERAIPFLPLPFFIIGYNIGINKQKLSNINNKVYIGLIFMGLVVVILESIINNGRTLYLGTNLIVVSMLCFASKNKSYKPKTAFTNLLSHIGEQHSTVIYIMHMMIAGITSFLLSTLLASFTESRIYEVLFPLFVIIATTIFSMLFKYVIFLVTKARNGIFQKIKYKNN